MKANELRIGNLFNYGVNIVPIKSIHTESVLKDEVRIYVELNEKIQNYCLDITEIKPIKLTEEWLLKFGFKKEKNVVPIYSLGKISIFLDCEMYPNGRVYFNSWCILKEKPKYVHKIQNLVFSLTNEELTFKSE